MNATDLTPASLDLFTSLVTAAPNWSGMPLYEGDKRANGNLVDLKKKGLVETMEDEGCVFVYFTEAGRDMALQVVSPDTYVEIQVTSADHPMVLFTRDPDTEPVAAVEPTPEPVADDTFLMVPAFNLNMAMVLAISTEGSSHVYGPFVIEPGNFGAEGHAASMRLRTSLWADVRVLPLNAAWAAAR